MVALISKTVLGMKVVLRTEIFMALVHIVIPMVAFMKVNG